MSDGTESPAWLAERMAGPDAPSCAHDREPARGGFRAYFLRKADALSLEDWQRLDTGDDPFLSHAFLAAAEASGAAAPRLGWQPMHLVLRDGQDGLAGFLPLYLRRHSFGDFSHDWNWPSAWQQYGLPYYPKLVSGIPFTPSPGPRLAVVQDAPPATRTALLHAVLDCAAKLGVSSWQCLFVRAPDKVLLQDAGLLMRHSVQFHWLSRGERDFADFLGRFTAQKRKKLKRERRAVQETGLRIEARHGDEIDASLWAAIHRHYVDTFLRHGNHPAFPLEFFQTAGSALGRRMVVFVAWQRDAPVASAICYRDGHTLYGRHWGTDIDSPGLHFELCYYQGIEYALAHGLQRFEPGAQGEHKLARGFEPVTTTSACWIADPRLRGIVADFLRHESALMTDYEAETARHLPWRQSADPAGE